MGAIPFWRENKMSSWSEAGTLKKIREALGVSQMDLSRKSGVSRASIANFENDRYSLSTADLAKIYDALAAIEVSRGIQPPNNEAARLLVEVLYSNIIYNRESVVDAERELQRAKQRLASTKGWLAEKEEAFKSAAKLVTLEDLDAVKEQARWHMPMYPRHRTNVRELAKLNVAEASSKSYGSFGSPKAAIEWAKQQIRPRGKRKAKPK